MLLIQIGLGPSIAIWIMGCDSSASFVVLINGSPTSFFTSSIGLRQGFHQSPLLFLLVIEGLSRLILKERNEGSLKGFKVATGIIISHFLFFNDVFIFGDGSPEKWVAQIKNISNFCLASGMEVNPDKSCFFFHEIKNSIITRVSSIWSCKKENLYQGFKYLGFCLVEDCNKKQ